MLQSGNADATLGKVLRGEQISPKTKQRDLIKHLRSINTPQDVIDEFERVQDFEDGKQLNRPLEITDLNTLIELDQMQQQEGNNAMLVDGQKYHDLQ